MGTADVIVLIFLSAFFCGAVAMMAPPHWFRDAKPARGRAVELTSNSRGHRHIRSSIELSRDEMFDSLASAAAEKLREPDLMKLDWLVTIKKDKGGSITKVSVEFYDDSRAKKRGKLWLVKG